MTRNWGLPPKAGKRAFLDARTAKPVMTLFVSAVFGIIGASVAAISFAGARADAASLFHGSSLVAAVIAAGFGCWMYVWLARPRFAAQFSGRGDAFSKLLRFYARAALGLGVVLLAGKLAGDIAPRLVSILLLCISGGAGAAAAFQTVLTFVPYYDEKGD